MAVEVIFYRRKHDLVGGQIKVMIFRETGDQLPPNVHKIETDDKESVVYLRRGCNYSIETEERKIIFKKGGFLLNQTIFYFPKNPMKIKGIKSLVPLITFRHIK